MKQFVKGSLAAAVMALAASSALADYYITGDNVNGKQWQVGQEDCRFTDNGDGTYTWTGSLGTAFKINEGDWTGATNIGSMGENEDLLTVGEYYRYTDAPHSQNINMNVKKIENAIVVLDTSHGTLLVNDQNNPIIPEPLPDPSVNGLSNTLPVLYINVYDEAGNLDNEIIDRNLSHKNYFNGNYWLDINGCKWAVDEGFESVGSKDEPLPLQIKARGNYTRLGFSKKPFKLKFDKKASLLGMSKSKHYTILAHADDNKGYLRNFTGFNIGKRMQLPWTPSQQPVEVVINGDYRGLYFLTEAIRVGDGRVPIQELEDNCTDSDLASGGYLIELDNYDEDNQIRLEEKGQYPGYKDMLRITYDTPEEYSQIQYDFVLDQFTHMNDLIGANSDDLWSYMDMDDAARYYLVEEIISHTEAYHGSTYMYRDYGVNQKWHFSPLWDCGNAFNGPTDGFFFDHSPFGSTWIGSMLMNNKFKQKVKDTWLWFMSNCYDGITSDIENYCNSISEAAKADHKRWGDAPTPDTPQATQVADNTDIRSRMNEVLYHLKSKTEWLKGQYGDYTGNTYPEPARDLTPCAPLPSFITTGVKGIDVEKVEIDSTATYYDLQGVKVAKPVKGLYIKVKEGKAEKVIF